MTKAEFLRQPLDDADTVTVSAKEYKNLLTEQHTASALAEKVFFLQDKLRKAEENRVELAGKILELKGKLPTYTIDMIG